MIKVQRNNNNKASKIQQARDLILNAKSMNELPKSNFFRGIKKMYNCKAKRILKLKYNVSYEERNKIKKLELLKLYCRIKEHEDSLLENFHGRGDWKDLRKEALRIYPNYCMKCWSEEDLTVDHIYPKSLFPDKALCIDNLQILCRSCNSSKSNRYIKDYRDNNRDHI